MAPTSSELQILITAKDDASKTLSTVGASADKMAQSHTKAAHATEGLSSVTRELTSSLGAANPEMGKMASIAQEVIGSSGSGLLGMAGAVALVGGAVLELGMSGGRLITELTQLSNVTGLSIERADFWSNALANVGAEAGALTSASRLLGNGIETINDALTAGNPLTTKSAALFDALGGSVRDANGQLLSGGQAIEQIVPQLAKMSDANERARVGQEVFGRSWATIAPLVANYTKAAEAAQRQTDDLADALGTNVADAMVEYNTRMNDLKDSMEILELKALPPVLTLLDRLVTVLDRIASIGDIDIKFNIKGIGGGNFGKVGDVLSLSAAFLDPLNILGFRGGGGGTAGAPGFFGGQNVPGGGLNSPPTSGPGSTASSAAAAYNAELEAKKLLEKQTNEYLQSIRDSADASRAAAKYQVEYNAALESFNKEQGRAVQTFLSLSGITSAASALFGATSREQADLRLKQAQTGLTTARFGSKAVHFGPGEGPGVTAKVEQQLKTIEAENNLLEARRVAANSLLITEQQRATEGEKLVRLTADQSNLIKDRLNPGIADLIPQLRTAATEYESMGTKIRSGSDAANAALLDFSRTLSEWKPPGFKAPTAPSSSSSQDFIPLSQLFTGSAWNALAGAR